MSAKYCAMSAKLKAMHSLYLTNEDYEIMLAQTTVPDVCAYLKNNTGYSDVLQDIDDKTIRRLNLEKYLENDLKKEYIRMYKFVEQNDRKILYMWFMRREADFIKRAVHCIFNGEDNDIELLPGTVSDFFKTHTDIDVEAVGCAKDFAQLAEACRETPFYGVLERSSRIDLNAFSINMRIDVYYYTYLWKICEKNLDAAQRVIFEEYAGRNIDMLNILWIYRNRKYYKLDREMVYTYLIPIRYRLSRDQIKELVESDDEQAFAAAVRKTVYAEIFSGIDEGFFAEERYKKMLYTTVKRIYKNHPRSIIAAFAYFRLKEIEISNIRTIIEGVRYGFDSDEIKRHICVQ